MIPLLVLLLKIIGIVLLGLLGMLLLILALVLFAPVFYRASVIHHPERTEITARIRYLFPLCQVTLQYLNGFSYKVRVFGYAMVDSKRPQPQKKEKKKKKKTTEPEKQTPVQSVTAVEKTPSDKKVTLPEKTPVAEQVKKEENTKRKEKTEKKTVRERLEQWKVLWHKKEEVQRILNKPESKQAISFVWSKCKHLFRHILPRNIKGYLAYGSSDPATTGKVLGMVSVLYAKTGPLVDIRPNFEEEQLECDLKLNGHIQLFTLLVIAAKVFFKKELRQMIEELKQVKEITE